VEVVNTRSGQLYVDEYWQGTHYMMGDIIVPPGIHLEVKPDTEVIISGTPETGYDHRLTVNGSIAVQSGAGFTMEEGVFAYWNGIKLYGMGIFESAVITGARRGITAVETADLSVTGCTFGGNLTGIHLLGISPEILSCLFTGNARYGIKEDRDALPVVRDCIFSYNTRDYYHYDETVMTPDELNEKGSDETDPDYNRFSGNTEE
jgi:hypothetical protein